MAFYIPVTNFIHLLKTKDGDESFPAFGILPGLLEAGNTLQIVAEENMELGYTTGTGVDTNISTLIDLFKQEYSLRIDATTYLSSIGKEYIFPLTEKGDNKNVSNGFSGRIVSSLHRTGIYRTEPETRKDAVGYRVHEIDGTVDDGDDGRDSSHVRNSSAKSREAHKTTESAAAQSISGGTERGVLRKYIPKIKMSFVVNRSDDLAYSGFMIGNQLVFENIEPKTFLEDVPALILETNDPKNEWGGADISPTVLDKTLDTDILSESRLADLDFEKKEIVKLLSTTEVIAKTEIYVSVKSLQGEDFTSRDKIFIYYFKDLGIIRYLVANNKWVYIEGLDPDNFSRDIAQLCTNMVKAPNFKTVIKDMIKKYQEENPEIIGKWLNPDSNLKNKLENIKSSVRARIENITS